MPTAPRIPFDALTLGAVLAEVAPHLGSRAREVRQPDATTLTIGLFSPEAGEAWLLLSCHPLDARAHLTTRRPANAPKPPAFCAALRARIEGAWLDNVRQVAFDRILELDFDGPKGPHTLVAELMGKHANLILIEAGGRIVSAAKWVGRSKSARPIASGGHYHRPPVLDSEALEAPPIVAGSAREWLDASPSPPPFAAKLVAAGAEPSGWRPVLSPGRGAYPVSVSALGLPEFARASISLALEQHFSAEIPRREAEALRASLLSRLGRLLRAREAALAEIERVEADGDRAGRLQRWGELILAYGSGVPLGAAQLTAWDYDGVEIAIPLREDLDFRENARLYFERAKRARTAAGPMREQKERIVADREQLEGILAKLERETRLDALREAEEFARSRRWLAAAPAPAKEERPFGGHRIRELLAPGGFPVLYGETAEANDYLTTRVAKPDDMWLHVRGAPSAHVVIVTSRRPEKLQPEQLRFAAEIAVRNSPSKHSGVVAVDYTLRKYVSKPRGARPGTAVYRNEKTLHVES